MRNIGIVNPAEPSHGCPPPVNVMENDQEAMEDDQRAREDDQGLMVDDN